MYVSGSQNARSWTERWVQDQAYCPNCGRTNVEKFPNNQPLADFHCLSCTEQFELKSQKTAFGDKVLDGEFHAKCRRLAANDNPNLMLLNYDRNLLRVTNFFVVPKHFFIRDIIEERKPLSEAARRAGWVGSKIVLKQVPEAGKIFFVRNGEVLPRKTVLEKWQQTLFLRDQNLEARGWLVEVMKCVELVGKTEFEIDDMYAFADRLARLYPNNRNVKPKIRQQLQFLRDRNFIEFVGRGRYRLRAKS
jgi:type II restriction enzyme